ncbi:DUF7507 domain-containing protein, partial [Pedobacter africanus]
TLTISGTVAAGAGGSLVNTVTVVVPAGSADPNMANNSSTVTTPVSRVMDFELSKVSSPVTAVAGQGLSYTITLKNNGPSSLTAADNLTLTDVLPAGFTATGYSAAAGSYTSSTGNWTGLTLASGQSSTLTITGNVAATATGSLSNTASLTLPSGISDPNTANNSATINTPVNRVMDLGISKTGAPKPAVAGETLTYTLTVTNNGPATLLASDILDVNDNLPLGFQATSYTPVSGTYTSATGSWAGLTLASGQSAVLTIAGKVTSGTTGSLTNVVSVVSPAGVNDPVAGNNTATDVTNITVKPVLTVVKTGPATVTAGSAVAYVLNITNTGSSDAVNADITDMVPASLGNVNWTSSVTGAAAVIQNPSGNGNAVNLKANIPAGAGNGLTVNISGTLNASASGTLSNTATATPAEASGTGSNSTSTANITRTSALVLSKTGPASALAGRSVTYQVEVLNNGPSQAAGTVITDAIAAELGNVTWTATAAGSSAITSGASGTGNAVNVTADLNVGDANKILLTITGELNAGQSNTVISNQASATASGGAAVLSNTVATTVSNQSSLTINKSGPLSINAGENITYNLTVSNNGPGNASSAVITDLIPAGLLNVSWSATQSGSASIVSAAQGTGNLNLTANIPAGGGNQVNILITGKVDPAFAGTSLSNTATVTPAESGNPAVNSNTVTTQVQKTAILQISKSGPPTGIAGQSITYRIQVTNTGPSDVAGARITDVIAAAILAPSWTIETSGSATVDQTSGTGNIDVLAGLKSNGTDAITITVTGTIDPLFTGTLSNTATATPAGVSNTSPVTSTVNTVVSAAANIRMIKSGPANVGAGEPIRYTLLVVNDGPSTAIATHVLDDLLSSAQLSTVSWTVTSSPGITPSASSGTGNVDLTADIPSGGELRVTITGTVSPALATNQTISNTATANSTVSDPDPANNTSTVLTTVDNDPVFRVAKTGPASVNIGDAISYKILVTNSGAGNIATLNVKDLVPADVVVSDWTAVTIGTASINNVTGGTATGNSNDVEFTGGIPTGAGNAIEVTVNGTISLAAANSITNTVSVTAGTVKQSSVVTAVNKSTDVAIFKQGPAQVAPGENVAYTIKVLNNGPVNVTGLSVTDVMPALLTNVSWTALTAGTASVSAASGTGDIAVTGNIAAGADNYLLFTVMGTVPANAANGSFDNTATVTLPSNLTDFQSTNNSSTVYTTVTNKTDIQVQKTGPAAAKAGEQIQYAIQVSNNGPSDATGLSIDDLLDANLANISWTVGTSGAATATPASGTGASVHVNGSIPAGAGNTITVNITATVNAAFAGTITNQARAQASGGAVVNSAVVSTLVSRLPQFEITKTGPASVNAGTGMAYTLKVTNTGISDAIGAVITDIVPAKLQNVTWSATASNTNTIISSAASGTGNVGLTATIPAGTANFITVVVNGDLLPGETGTLSNTATVTPAETGIGLNSAAVVTNIQSVADLSITNTANIPAQKVGQPVTFTLTVKNNGPGNASAVAVNNLLPAGYTAISSSSTNYNAATGVWTIGNLASGADLTLTITANLVVGGPYQTTATVSAAETDPVMANNTAQATINVENTAPVAIAHTGSLLEDQPFSVNGTNGLLQGATDADGDALSIAKFVIAGITGDFSVGTEVSIPAVGGILINADGSYAFNPELNYNGSVPLITYTVTDGKGGTANNSLSLTVGAVNDVPVFVKGPDVSVLQYAAAQTVNGWATNISAGPADESAQALDFVVTNANNSLFAVQPAIDAAGNLTFTPAAAATGTALVSVYLHDNGGVLNGGADRSAVQTFNITINPASPALLLSKVAGNTGTKAGDVINYTFTVKNTGDVDLTNVVVTDAGATAITPASIPLLAVNASATVTASHTLSQAEVNAGRYANQAAVTARDPGNVLVSYLNSDDPNTPALNDSTVVNIVPSASMNFTKVAGNTGNKAGDVINYILVVSNTGNVTLSNIVVADPGADPNSISPVFVASLAPNATASFTAKHTLTQADVDAGSYSNHAAVSANRPGGFPLSRLLSDDPATAAAGDATVVAISPSASMSLSKVASNTGSKAGDVINYTLVVSNTGNVTLSNVTVSDAGADAGSISPAVITSLAPGAS